MLAMTSKQFVLNNDFDIATSHAMHEGMDFTMHLLCLILAT